MNPLKRVLCRPLTCETRDYLVSQLLIYVGALSFLVVAMRKLSTVTLTEGEYFLGILVLSVSILMILVGMMINLLGELKRRERST